MGRCGHWWIDVWSIARRVIVLGLGIGEAKLQLGCWPRRCAWNGGDGNAGPASYGEGDAEGGRPIGSCRCGVLSPLLWSQEKESL